MLSSTEFLYELFSVRYCDRYLTHINGSFVLPNGMSILGTILKNYISISKMSFMKWADIDRGRWRQFLCSVTLAVTATWINSCLFSERTEYLCEIEQYYSIDKCDGNLQRIDRKSWTIELWPGHEWDMSETCNGFYNISSPCLGNEA